VVVTALSGGALTLDAQLASGALLHGGDGKTYLSILVTGANVQTQKRRLPLNLALVIDRSGSMSGEKIEHARRAAVEVIDRLDEGDRISVIDFGTDVRVLAPSVPATAGERDRLKALVLRLPVNGGTNISGGLQAGLQQLEPYQRAGVISRMVLMSDGQANEGITSPQGLGQIAERAAREGITVSSLGLGLDYNENTMTRIAELGGGQYYYVREASQLAQVFAGELELASATVAQDVQVRIEPAAGVRVSEVHGYPYRTEADGSVWVSIKEVAARQTRRILVGLNVPVQATGARDVAQVELRFTDALASIGQPAGAPVAGPSRVIKTSVHLTVVADASTVDRSRNAQVLERVAEVELARTVNQSMEAYGRGEARRAKLLLDAQLAQLETLNNRIGSAKLAGKLRSVRSQASAGVMAAPASTARGQDLMKAQKARAFDDLR
jgi:Ca-activated chloride channel family protein